MSNLLILEKRSEKRSIKCPTNSTLQVLPTTSYLENDNNQMLVQKRAQEIVFTRRDGSHIGGPKQENDDHASGPKQSLWNFTCVQIILFLYGIDMATGHVNVNHRLLYRAHFADHVIVEILSSAHAYLNINYEEGK